MAEENVNPGGFVAPSLEELAPLFPAYEIEVFIAAGGMGAVYKARQKSLDRDVAIKILPREFGEDEQFRASFEAEAKAMARLNHPNLIAVYDFGDIDGMLFIIMEFVQGKALYYSAHKKAIDPAVALGLVSTISRGLAHAHEGGIIHRDIKPANILLDTNAKPKIGDFGLARPLDRDRSEGVVFGTPGYTAPEVYNRSLNVDQRSDIFSTGALLYELLCGKRPEPDSTSMATGIDPRIDAIITKATHANPNHRYMDAEDLAEDLEALIPKLSGPQFATGKQATLTGIGAGAGAAPSSTHVTPLASSKQKSAALPILLILGILLGGGALAFLMMKEDKPAPPPQKITDDDSKDGKEKKKDPTVKKKPSSKKERMTNTPKAKNPASRKKPRSGRNPKPKPQVSPLQALETLRGALRSGSRNEFPPSTQKTATSAFFIVTKKMTWPQAATFAKRHGAQLANLPSKADLEWAHENLKPQGDLWLGAADSGTEGRWFWNEGTTVDPSLWKEDEPNNMTVQAPEGEDFAVLTAGAPTFDDRYEGDQYEFLLEWKLDGSQPGSQEAELERIGQALAAGQTPVFPTGTYNVGGSRFLPINRLMQWFEAREAAKAAGGHLAVFSNQAESDFASRILTSRLEENISCWTGMIRDRDSASGWKTITGEPFAFAKWHEHQPDDMEGNQNHFVLKKLGGVVSGNDTGHGGRRTRWFLIEWSVPSLRNTSTNSNPAPETPQTNDNPATKVDPAAMAEVEEIRDLVRNFHSRDYRKFRRKYDKVVKDFIGDTISTVNNANKLSAPVRAKIVEELKDYEKRNELPKTLPKTLPKLAPKPLRRTLKKAHRETDALWEGYGKNFDEAKTDYLDRLTEAADRAYKKNQKSIGDTLLLEASTTKEDDDRFHQIMDKKKVPLPTPPAQPE